MSIISPKRILISRTDSIGDVMLTLPLCGLLKKEHPGIKIFFLGSNYTRDVIETSENVDAFIDYTALQKSAKTAQIKAIKELKIDCIIHVFPKKEIAQLAKVAGIPIRIGTTNRLYHWFACNQLIKLSRKNSSLHESQLNVLLAKNLLNRTAYSLAELATYTGFSRIKPLPEKFSGLIDKTKFNLIIHPKSKGSAREWPLEKYATLIKSLPHERFQIFISGTTAEGALLKNWLKNLEDKVTDISGLFTLSEFISFINECNGLIAASTGPLHIAAALGKHVLGFFPPIKPMHPGRWQAIGEKAEFICFNKPHCKDCKTQPLKCSCITSIEENEVKEKIMNWLN